MEEIKILNKLQHEIGNKVETQFPGFYYYFIGNKLERIILDYYQKEELLFHKVKEIELLSGFDGWIVNPLTGIIENDLKPAVDALYIYNEMGKGVSGRSLGEVFGYIPWKRIRGK